MFPKTLCQNLGLEITPEIEAEIHEAAASIDLTDTLRVGRYGAPEHSGKDIGHSHNEAVTSISQTITSLVSSLERADPQLALKRKKSGFFARFTGQDAVNKVQYVQATEDIDRQLSEVPGRIERLEAIIDALDEDFRALLRTQKTLKVHLVAGKWFLEENPESGTDAVGYGLNSPRDRLSKRLQNLAALVTSNDSTLHQIQLLQANSINMLDRLHEITTVLVPSWRSHRMGLYINDQDYEAIREATRAHEALVSSLREL